MDPNYLLSYIIMTVRAAPRVVGTWKLSPGLAILGTEHDTVIGRRSGRTDPDE